MRPVLLRQGEPGMPQYPTQIETLRESDNLNSAFTEVHTEGVL